MQQVAGKALLQHVLDTSLELKSCQPHIVVGDQASLVKASVSAPKNRNGPNKQNNWAQDTRKTIFKRLKSWVDSAYSLWRCSISEKLYDENLVKAAGKSSLASFI